MSLETSLVTALSATFGGRVFADTAQAGTARPFMTYQQVGGRPSNSLCGNTTQQNARLQFNVWATTRNQASTLMRTVEAIVTAAPLYGTSQGSLIAEYNDPTDTYGAMQDFSFWS